MCRRIHFLSVKTLHYFRVITEPLKFNLQGNQDNRTVRADNEIGARDSQNRNRNSTTPLSLHWRGGPGRVHLPSSGHFKESLLGRSASTTGQVARTTINSQTLSETPVYISNVQESPVAKKLTAKVGHMVTWQSTTIRRNQGRRYRHKNLNRTYPIGDTV